MTINSSKYLFLQQQKYSTFGTFTKSNDKAIERGKIDTPDRNTYNTMSNRPNNDLHNMHIKVRFK
jgi:hypothetical protein